MEEKPARPARPRDAAGLVLLRRKGKDREVLLGRRRATARFLPGVYVYPGGRLDKEDRLHSGFEERFATLPAGLDRATTRLAPALLRAALRETFEESGVLVGKPGKPTGPERESEIWQAYRAAGLTPAFHAARLFVRAVTPTFSKIRFHTRFFIMDATDLAVGEVQDGELEDVGWVPLAEARKLPMVDVTEFVLDLAQLPVPEPRVTLFSYRNDELRPDLKERLTQALSTLGTLPRRD
jgi:8-oxo-dGTP pyrophosphatase MutT (NUDIX family)